MAVEESNSRDTSPKALQMAANKMKFFCSHGGMILPRPCDGHLKYVGGETRVISAPRNIFLSDLMGKINSMFDGDFVLKYQIVPEELDALVSVKNDEDLRYMFDEHDRLERGGTSKLRTFLFPSKPTMIESQSPTSTITTPQQSLEQRYVDALNGIVRLTTNHNTHFASARRPSRLKSVCSSPSECTSPCSLSPRSVAYTTSINADTASFINNLHGKLNNITRVHSSPSLCGLVSHSTTPPSNGHNHESNHLVYPAAYQSNHHQHHQQQQQQQHQPWMSPPRDACGRVPIISHHPPTIQSPTHYHGFHKGGGGSGGHSRWAHLGQYAGGYNGISHRTTSIHSESPGIIWD